MTWDVESQNREYFCEDYAEATAAIVSTSVFEYVHTSLLKRAKYSKSIW